MGALREWEVHVAANQRKSKGSDRSASPSPARRRAAVLISLVAVLTLTSALLRALAPAPLNPQASTSLYAIEPDGLFGSTSVPVSSSRWHSIYIHHSATTGGSAQTLALSNEGLPDHFVLGNGDGCGDGEVQIGQRWAKQESAGRTAGTDYIKTDCISICLIGDFNEVRPTAEQQKQLTRLVYMLQRQFNISAQSIFFDTRPATPAGLGRLFPAQEFRNQILP